tara:strand:- start:182 stop:547 length:366 start_codon:yes stop_codon:yes gene_type:complete
MSYKPWYTNWKGWTGVGVGVVGLIMGPVFWGQYQDVPQVAGGGYANFADADRARSRRALGATGFVLAGVGAVGGALAFLFLKDEDVDGRSAQLTIQEPLKLQAIAPVFSGDSASLSATFSF